MSTVGVIGGLGPMATVYFLELLTKMTDAAKDQEHLRIYMASIPDTPDRTAYILGESDENPMSCLVEAGNKLVQMGADFIAIPCVTAQYFHQELESALSVPVISLCEELAMHLAHEGVKKVGVLATNGTIKSRLMQNCLEEKGIEVCIPGPDDQDTVMQIIYQQIKKGLPPDVEAFEKIGQKLKADGAGKLILGCTELSLIKKDYGLNKDYLDVMEVLAAAVIVKAGRKPQNIS